MSPALIQLGSTPSRTRLTDPGPTTPDEVSVVITGPQEAGHGVAQLWRGPALLGIVQEEHGVIVLRLESHAGGPLTVGAVALERALAEARARLASRSNPFLNA